MLLELEIRLVVLPETNNNLIVVGGRIYGKVEFCHEVWIAVPGDNFRFKLITLGSDRKKGITSFFVYQRNSFGLENVHDQLIGPYVQVWCHYCFETLS